MSSGLLKICLLKFDYSFLSAHGRQDNAEILRKVSGNVHTKNDIHKNPEEKSREIKKDIQENQKSPPPNIQNETKSLQNKYPDKRFFLRLRLETF